MLEASIKNNFLSMTKNDSLVNSVAKQDQFNTNKFKNFDKKMDELSASRNIGSKKN